MKQDRQRAQREVRRLVEAEGVTAFAARADIDPGTLGDFIAGKRWSSGPTRAKIEKALGWPLGRIVDIAEGLIVEQVADGQAQLLSYVERLSEVDREMVTDFARRLASGGGES